LTASHDTSTDSPTATRPAQPLDSSPQGRLIENWFGIISRQSIRCGTFASVKALINRIRAYITHWNSNPEPFVWTATTDEILAQVLITQTNVKKLVENNTK
jgi:hypothetical protein